MTNQLKELIAIEVIRTLQTQFDKFPEDEINNRNTPFQDAFLKAFKKKLKYEVSSIPIFISLTSWMHGLNTSLGQTLLENIAHILCDGEKKEFTTKKRTVLKISQNQKNVINTIITDLSNDKRVPNILNENAECIVDSNPDIDATDFTVDIYIEDDNQIICIELRTVKPNKGAYKVEKENILEAKIALKNAHPNKEIHYLLGFPFDPLSDTPTGFDKQRYMDYSVGFRKYFADDEFLLSSELWDYLSGEKNTMNNILEIINNIADAKFLKTFEFINDINNFNTKKYFYLKKLKKWYLFSSIDIMSNFELLKNKSVTDWYLQKFLNQSLFDNENKYKLDSIRILQSKIS